MNANKLIPLALCWMALLFGWQSSSAQNPFELTYDRTGSVDNGTSTIELSNGNLLIAGSTQNGVNASSGTDGFLTEMNPKTGKTVWSRAYGWGNNDGFHKVIQASDSTIVVVGFANQSVNNGPADMWFLRVDTSGNTIASSIFNRTSRSLLTDVTESNVLDSVGGPTFLVTSEAMELMRLLRGLIPS